MSGVGYLSSTASSRTTAILHSFLDLTYGRGAEEFEGLQVVRVFNRSRVRFEASQCL